MKIFLDNVNVSSSSGPNGFASKLIPELSEDHEVHHSVESIIANSFIPDVQASFIFSNYKIAPIVQRLDGIYFNSEQDFENLNRPIESTYSIADAVIFQSEFNKRLTEKFFGKRDNSFVISNGTPLDTIRDIPATSAEILDSFENLWMCASSWRPHKRLKENVRYFLEMSDKNDCLIIAGENPDVRISDPRIFYAGHMSWLDMIALMKRSKYFLHLAWLDHCPNVVIDARAAGCKIICSSAGGTSEIAGTNSIVILEDEWDLSPVRLYEPPAMDFSKTTVCQVDSDIDIKNVSKKYIEVMSGVVKS